MITPTQKRALRAQSLLDSGMDAREAARECGYKNVNGMMGAIALCLRKLPGEDRHSEMERMQEESAPAPEPIPEPVCTGEYEKPGIYELPGKGEVLVGERISKEEHNNFLRMKREKAMERFAERNDTVITETKRVGIRYGKNDKTERLELRIHVFGIDKWIVIDEEMVGGKEAMLRIIGDIIAGCGVVMEGIA